MNTNNSERVYTRKKSEILDNDKDDVILYGVKLPSEKRRKLLETVNLESVSEKTTTEKKFFYPCALKVPLVPLIKTVPETAADTGEKDVVKTYSTINDPCQQNNSLPIIPSHLKDDYFYNYESLNDNKINYREVMTSTQIFPINNRSVDGHSSVLNAKAFSEFADLEKTLPLAQEDPIKGEFSNFSVANSNTTAESMNFCLASSTSSNANDKNICDADANFVKQPSNSDLNSTNKSPSVHQQVIEKISELCSIYDSTGDKWRATSFRKAIARIQNCEAPLSKENYTKLKNEASIGRSIFNSIEEIIKTGSCQRLEIRKKDEQLCCLNKFLQVWGIGQKSALSLYRKGIRSIEELRERQNELLTKVQRIGLKYYEDFNKKIPRSEIDSILATVRSQLQKFPFCENIVDSIVCGSYRRGKKLCGDVDILLIKIPTSPLGLLEELKQRLHAMKFLRDDLACGYSARRLKRSFMYKYHAEDSSNADATTDSENSSDEKVHPEYIQFPETYYGVCVDLNGSGIHRRIDIKIYPMECKAFAMLYFTGSAFFNRGMRLLAKQKGFRLDDRGMFHRSSIGCGFKKSVPCTEEHDIFQALGLKYRAPEDRESF